MPRLHSVSHYHSQPNHKQASFATMTAPSLLHNHPRHPLKHRPLSSAAHQNSPNHPLRRSLNVHPPRSHTPSNSTPTTTNVTEPLKPQNCFFIDLDPFLRSTTPSPKPCSAPSTLSKASRKSANKPARKSRDHASKSSSLSQLPAPSQPPTDGNQSDKPRSSAPHSRLLIMKVKQHPRPRSTSPSPSPVVDPELRHKHMEIISCPPSSVPRAKKSIKPPGKKTGKARPERRRTRTHPSDATDVEPIFDQPAPLSLNPSRSTTPCPVKPAEPVAAVKEPSGASRKENAKPLLRPVAPNPAASLSPSHAVGPAATRTARIRQHARAKSVASILDANKTPADALSPVAKDDWDMPIVIPPRDLTWQQKRKPAPKPSEPHSNLTQKLAQQDRGSDVSFPTRSKSTKPAAVDAATGRRQRAVLSRTSSAGSALSGAYQLKAMCEDQTEAATSQPSEPCPVRLESQGSSSSEDTPTSSRSLNAIQIPIIDENLPLTWQQSIMRSSPPKNSSVASDHHSDKEPEHKPIKKTPTNSVCFKTPVKSMNISCRKPGAASAIKPTSGAGVPPTKRRNSLSSGPTQYVYSSTPMPLNQMPGLFSTKTSTGVSSSWKPLPLATTPAGACVVGKAAKSAARCTTPTPMPGNQTSDSTLLGSTIKACHSRQLTLVNRPINQLNPTQSEPVPKATEEIRPAKVMTPTKSRSTSELLKLLTPIGTPGKGADGTMYAGPQFHNSPSPAALPAPKFAFVSS